MKTAHFFGNGKPGTGGFPGICGGLNETNSLLLQPDEAQIALNVEFDETGLVRKIPGRARLTPLGVDAANPSTVKIVGIHEHFTAGAFFILSGINASLVFNDGGAKTASITVANYVSGSALATALQTALNAVSTGFLVSYSGLKFTIARSSGTFSVTWGSNLEIAATLGMTGTYSAVNTMTSTFTTALANLYAFGNNGVLYRRNGTTWFVLKSDLTASDNIWRCASHQDGLFSGNGLQTLKIRNNRALKIGITNPDVALACGMSTESPSYSLLAYSPYTALPYNAYFGSYNTRQLYVANSYFFRFKTNANQYNLFEAGAQLKKGSGATGSITLRIRPDYLTLGEHRPATTTIGTLGTFNIADLSTTFNNGGIHVAYGWANCEPDFIPVQPNTFYWLEVYVNSLTGTLYVCVQTVEADLYLWYGPQIFYVDGKPDQAGIYVQCYPVLMGKTGDTYDYACTLVSHDGYETLATPPVTATLISYSTVNLSVIPTPAAGEDCYARKLYRSFKNSNILYLLDTINDITTTTYADIKQDSDLGAQYDDSFREPPPVFSMIVSIQNRLAVAGNPGYPEIVYFSQTYIPQYFDWSDLMGSILFELVGNNETITGLAVYHDTELVVLKTNSIFRMLNLGTDVFQIVEVITDRIGSIAPDSVKVVTDADGSTFLCFLAPDGDLYLFDGSRAARLSKRNNFKVLQNINSARLSNVCAGTVGFQYHIFVTSHGASANDSAYVYNSQLKTFSALDFGAICAATAEHLTGLDGTPYLLTGNAAGLVWQERSGLDRDGSTFTSTFKSAPLHLGDPGLVKHFHRLLSYLKMADATQVVTLTPAIENTSLTAQAFAPASTNLKFLPCLIPGTGRYLDLKWSATDKLGQWELHGYDVELTGAGRR